MPQTSRGSGDRWSARAITGVVVWLLVTAAVAAWLLLLAFWDAVEIFSTPSPEQKRHAWVLAVASSVCFAAGPLGTWWFARHRAWLILSAIAFAVPLSVIAIFD